MKKVVFLFSIFVLLSCSSSDESSNNSDFNPPAWIQGTWKQESDIGGLTNSFSFPENDICFVNLGAAKQCQQGLVNLARQGRMKVNVIEAISDTHYSAEIIYSSGQSTTYSFNKISNTEIEFEAVTGVVFTKQ